MRLPLAFVMSEIFELENDSQLIAEVEAILRENGPQTGGWMSEKLAEVHPVRLWRACYASQQILIQNCARYYLRYDITRGNSLRLSPSILRDFLTFSLLHVPEQRIVVIEAGTRIANKFRMISLRKLSLARDALLRLPQNLQDEINKSCVVFLSGDIAYYLAHDTPRKHSTMGVNIKGSDIDIVIVNNLEADPKLLSEIESELLKIKHQYLVNASIGEELDFIVKPITRMIDQFGYRDIHQKIASKILYESFFLMGRVDIYQSLMGNLEVSGARKKIEDDFETALSERKETIRKIMALSHESSTQESDVSSLFYASQERLEFT